MIGLVLLEVLRLFVVFEEESDVSGFKWCAEASTPRVDVDFFSGFGVDGSEVESREGSTLRGEIRADADFFSAVVVVGSGEGSREEGPIVVGVVANVGVREVGDGGDFVVGSSTRAADSTSAVGSEILCCSFVSLVSFVSFVSFVVVIVAFFGE